MRTPQVLTNTDPGKELQLSQNSYRQIVRSSSIMGGSAAVTMAIGMVKTKAAALLIGSSGMGILANLTAVQAMMSTLAQGLQASAVQQLSEALGSSSEEAVARSRAALSRLVWVAGVAIAVITAMLSFFLSQWMFQNDRHVLDIVVVGIAVLLATGSGGYLAILQAHRKIFQLAGANVMVAGLGTVLVITLYAWQGVRGIALGLLLQAVAQWVVTQYWMHRYVPSLGLKIYWSGCTKEMNRMVRLGLSMAWSSLLTGMVLSFTNALITRQIGLSAAGINSAAFALSGMFVNFVLSAMGSDFYPRLSRLAHDKVAMNKVINQQVEVGLLLATPGLLATLGLSHWIVRLFYSAEFLPASQLLQWYVLGCFIRVIQFPMGYSQLVMDNGRWFLLTQTVFNLLHALLIWMSIHWFGIEGVAIAFFSLYVFSLGVIWRVAHHLTGFTWSRSTQALILKLLPLMAVMMVLARMLPLWIITLTSLLATFLSGIYCLQGLVLRVGEDHRIIKVLFAIPGLQQCVNGMRIK